MNNLNKIEIRVSSDLDYENLIAEIEIDGKYIGIMSNEPKKGLCFEIPDGKDGFNAIDLEAFKMALERARMELLGELKGSPISRSVSTGRAGSK